MGFCDAHFIASERARVPSGNELESSLRRSAQLSKVALVNRRSARTHLKRDKLLSHLRSDYSIRTCLQNLSLLRYQKGHNALTRSARFSDAPASRGLPPWCP